jgi:hypothetical protein
MKVTSVSFICSKDDFSTNVGYDGLGCLRSTAPSMLTISWYSLLTTDPEMEEDPELRDPVATVLNVNIDYIKSTLWRGSSYTFSWWLHHALLLIKMPSLLLAVPITNSKQTSL